LPNLFRKVETSEAEKLALKENILFFEISAKTNENVKKLFYSVIAELPFFEQFTTNKLKLIGELGNIYLTLEEENNETRFGDITTTETPGVGLSLKKQSSIKKKQGCC
jgi:hypothetical protein